jgi:hypothetical protein
MKEDEHWRKEDKKVRGKNQRKDRRKETFKGRKGGKKLRRSKREEGR